jgi:hypothetical protein
LSPDDLAVLDHYQRWQAGDAKLLGNPWMFIHVDLDEASWNLGPVAFEVATAACLLL